MKNAVILILIVTLVVGAVYVGFFRRPPKAKTSAPVEVKPSILLSLPDFSLTAQDGESYGSDELSGRAWIANFIFTRCQATCPAQTARLAEIQEELRRDDSWADVRLVSISVDPEQDTPEVLKKYADDAGADEDHWKFLTGEREQIWELSKSGFKLPVAEESLESQVVITHSPRFVLVDHQGAIRGFYDSGSPDELVQLKEDLRLVLQERVLAPDDEIIDPPWLEPRRAEQIKSAAKMSVFHAFSFQDLRKESGITFRNRSVDDSGRTWKPAHYDHGNGVAVADVDGDGLLDLYFVTQVGRNELWRNKGDARFEDITDKAGVAVADRIGVTASFADIDNDGDADLYVTNVLGGNVMFLNDGGGKFTDISADSGLDYSGHCSSAEFFDYNRDGKLDLFLVNVGVYTTSETVAARNDRTTGSDKAQYEFRAANPDAFAAHLKPERSEYSILFENQGDNKFVDVSEKTGLRDASWSGDASPLDANEDGWPDLYILNMQGHDEYYENQKGRFVKKSRDLFRATPWGSMGIKVFDFDNDGRMDIFLTDMHTDMATKLGPREEKQKIPSDAMDPSLMNTDGVHVWGNAFFHNLQGRFVEVSDTVGAENYWPWGLSTGDINADGFEDAFLTSCMNYPFRYGVNSLLLNNQGKGFLDSEFILGVEPRRGGRTATPWFELDAGGRDRDHDLAKKARKEGRTVNRLVVWGALGSRSSAIFDLDNDGDLDIVTNDFNSEPMVLISNLAEKKKDLRYLKIELVGAQSNRNGLGARVKVVAGDDEFTKVRDGQSGYLSQSLLPLYFGLGKAERLDKVIVQWPSGNEQTIDGPIEMNKVLTVSEPE